MTTTEFTPTLYSKEGCPFSFKARVFLLEAGLANKVKVVQGSTPEEHKQIAEMLASRLGKASFPTAEIAHDSLLPESDAIVAHFAELAAVDPKNMPTYQAYVQSIFPMIMRLYRENAELKKGAA